LFICGGAFTGLENVIEQRTGVKSLGFGSNVQKRDEKKMSDYLKEVQPEDLLKFGMIPEFIGRLPVIAVLHELSEEAMIEILTKPKNALVKQYKRLFEMDNVNLKFAKGALSAIAKEAAKYKSGARGLRSILENAMLEVMYEVPSMPAVKEVVVSEETILKKERPLIMYEKDSSVTASRN
jgi:ATP-dependent Clp protease ATP-binding subunit ClpX